MRDSCQSESRNEAMESVASGGYAGGKLSFMIKIVIFTLNTCPDIKKKRPFPWPNDHQ